MGAQSELQELQEQFRNEAQRFSDLRHLVKVCPAQAA